MNNGMDHSLPTQIQFNAGATKEATLGANGSKIEKGPDEANGNAVVNNAVTAAGFIYNFSGTKAYAYVNLYMTGHKNSYNNPVVQINEFKIYGYEVEGGTVPEPEQPDDSLKAPVSQRLTAEDFELFASAETWPVSGLVGGTGWYLASGVESLDFTIHLKKNIAITKMVMKNGMDNSLPTQIQFNGGATKEAVLGAGGSQIVKGPDEANGNATVTNSTITADGFTYNFSTPVAYEYLNLYMTGAMNAGGYGTVQINNFELYGYEIDGVGKEKLQPKKAVSSQWGEQPVYADLISEQGGAWADGVGSATLDFDFGKVVKVDSARFVPWTNYQGTPTAFTVSYSNDGSNYTELDSITGIYPVQPYTTIAFDAVEARYIRVQFADPIDKGGNICLTKVMFYGKDATITVEDGANIGIIGISASSSADGTSVDVMSDSYLDTYWASAAGDTNPMLTYNLNGYYELSELRIYARKGGAAANFCKDYSVEYSLDRGETFQRADFTASEQDGCIRLTGSMRANAIRLVCNNSGNVVEVGELIIMNKLSGDQRKPYSGHLYIGDIVDGNVYEK